MNRMLKAIEIIGRKSRMRLSKRKCEAVKNEGHAQIMFLDKPLVRTVEKSKYLGCVLNKDNNTTAEVRGIIRDAMGTLKKMHIYWRHSNCNLKHKLMVTQAVLFAKILLGLSLIHI